MIIWTPRKEIILPGPRLNIGMQGFFKMETFKCIETFGGPVEIPGTRRTVVPWQPNKILTAGRNYIGDNGSWMTYCQVGTGSTPPVAGDTGLETWLAGTSYQYADSYSAQPSAPYYGYRRRTWRFNAGEATGNISEAGVGWGSSGATLFSRTLIVDGAGDPTTATVLADEYLDVAYELRYYPPTSDVFETASLGGFTYDLTTRAATVTNSTYWGSVVGSEMGQYSAFATDWSAYDGALGTLEQDPSGNSAACDHPNQYNGAYSNNSYERTMYCDTGTAGWNLGAGIRSIRWRSTGGSYQTQFVRQGGGNETIPKDNTNGLSVAWTIAWSEYVIP